MKPTYIILVRKTNIPEDPFGSTDQVLPARELQTPAIPGNAFQRQNLPYKKYNYPQTDQHLEDFFPPAKKVMVPQLQPRYNIPQTQNNLWNSGLNNLQSQYASQPEINANEINGNTIISTCRELMLLLTSTKVIRVI